MKLKEYTKQHNNPKAKAAVLRTISANAVRGIFFINTRLLYDLGLQDGQYAMVANDEDSRNDWYITFQADEATGSKISTRQKGGSILSMRFQNKSAARALLASIEAENSATFMVSQRPTTMPDGKVWYRIVTSNPVRTR